MDKKHRDSNTPEVNPEPGPCNPGKTERYQAGYKHEQAGKCPDINGEPCIQEEDSPAAGPEIPAEGPGAPAAESGTPEEALNEVIQALTLERDQWKSKAAEYWDSYLRAMSEMDNFRKRTERDIHTRINRGKSELILPLLDVLDNFDRALAAGEKNAKADQGSGFKAFYDGVALIRRQILDVLAREWVEPIEDPVGKAFDPKYHEAMFAQEGGGEHGTIVQEFQKGYMYKGEVLRPSRVKVIR